VPGREGCVVVVVLGGLLVLIKVLRVRGGCRAAIDGLQFCQCDQQTMSSCCGINVSFSCALLQARCCLRLHMR
jgi:hypothetical protein